MVVPDGQVQIVYGNKRAKLKISVIIIGSARVVTVSFALKMGRVHRVLGGERLTTRRRARKLERRSWVNGGYRARRRLGAREQPRAAKQRRGRRQGERSSNRERGPSPSRVVETGHLELRERSDAGSKSRSRRRWKPGRS